MVKRRLTVTTAKTGMVLADQERGDLSSDVIRTALLHDEALLPGTAGHCCHAVRKEAISAVMDLGTPGEQVAYRLIHAHCRRRLGGSKPSTLP